MNNFGDGLSPLIIGITVGRCNWFFLPVFLSITLSITGCVIIPAALVTASAVGVEYSMTNVASKVFPVERFQAQEAVNNAVERLTLNVDKTWEAKESEAILIASTEKHNIEIRVETFAPSATKVWVNAYNKEISFLKDKSLATAVLLETERELGVNRQRIMK